MMRWGMPPPPRTGGPPGASGRSATVCMVASRVGGSNLTLPKCRSLSTSPWDLEGEPAVGENLFEQLRSIPLFFELDGAESQRTECESNQLHQQPLLRIQ